MEARLRASKKDADFDFVTFGEPRGEARFRSPALAVGIGGRYAMSAALRPAPGRTDRRHACLVRCRLALRQVIAIAEPEGVDGLSFVVHAHPRAERAQMCLHSPRTEPQQLRCGLVGPSADVCAQNVELALGREQGVPDASGRWHVLSMFAHGVNCE